MKFYKLFLFLLIGFESVDAFNVKVLLAKISKEKLSENPIVLKSTTGFFINESGEKQKSCAEKKITISLKEGGLFINKEKIAKGQVSVRTQLSPHQKKGIVALVKQWVYEVKKLVEVDFNQLKPLCDKLVSKKKHKSALKGQRLEAFFLRWLDQFCEHLIKGKHNPQDLERSLQLSAKKRVYAYAKDLFIQKTSSVSASMSKTDYYKLGNREAFRHTFFFKIVLECLQELATDFLLSLSDQEVRRVMSNSLHGIEYESGIFWGDLYILEHKNNFLIVNCLDIDDYLVSVLNAEAWPGWPLEAYKTLMIASRSYLVAKVLEAVRCKRLFHIKNTISHQTYKGYCKVHKNILRAAEETRDIIMTHKGKIVEAMFDSCCGGVIPAKISDFSFKKVPYLARTKVCDFCKPCWIYRWKSSFTETQMIAKLQKVIPDLKKIRDVRIMVRDDAKLVKKVMVFDGKKRHYVTGKKMYSLFPEIKSFCFEIKKKNKQFLVSGRGYGHHIGLCQWGARKMVDAHWNYKSILKFYYPGIEFMQLSFL